MADNPVDGQERMDAAGTLLRKFRARDAISVEEERVIQDSISDIRTYKRGRVIVRADTPISESILLFEGFVARYKDLADGRRQIMDIHVPGDFVDLHGFLLGHLEHNVAAMSSVRVAAVPHDALRRISELYPHLARTLWFMTLVDAAVLREQILSVGRRAARARIAHLLCEFNLRLEVVGLSEEGRFALPLTQTNLADATGLTAIHVNRTLRTLRDQGLATFRGGEVTIHDWPGLKAAAEFDSGYLYLDHRRL